MVRKTKQEALATRSALLDAAEHLFQAHGVSGTSLQDIASAAGVTRGAVYWHFKDKGDLFNAMMERVCLPMEEFTGALLCDDDAAPLKALREHVIGIFERITTDPQLQRVFDVATHKIEYVDEMSTVHERHRLRQREHTVMLERWLRAAQKRGELRRAPGAPQMAIGLHALVHGLIHSWMLDPGAFDLLKVGRRTLDLHLVGLAAGT